MVRRGVSDVVEESVRASYQNVATKRDIDKKWLPSQSCVWTGGLELICAMKEKVSSDFELTNPAKKKKKKNTKGYLQTVLGGKSKTILMLGKSLELEFIYF